MIDTEWLYTLVERVFLMNRRQPVHLGVELKRNAVGIAGAKRARLIGALDPFDRQIPAPEEVGRLVEVFFAEHLETEITGLDLVGLSQHDAMVAALFHRPKIDRIRA